MSCSVENRKISRDEFQKILEGKILEVIKSNANRNDEEIKRSRDKREGAAISDILRVLSCDLELNELKQVKKLNGAKKSASDVEESDYKYLVTKILKKLLKEKDSVIEVIGQGKGTRYVYKEPKLTAVNLHNSTIAVFQILNGSAEIWVPLINKKIAEYGLDYEIHIIPMGNYLFCIDGNKNRPQKTRYKALYKHVESALSSLGCEVI